MGKVGGRIAAGKPRHKNVGRSSEIETHGARLDEWTIWEDLGKVWPPLLCHHWKSGFMVSRLPLKTARFMHVSSAEEETGRWRFPPKAGVRVFRSARSPGMSSHVAVQPVPGRDRKQFRYAWNGVDCVHVNRIFHQHLAKRESVQPVFEYCFNRGLLAVPLSLMKMYFRYLKKSISGSTVVCASRL